MKRRFRDSQYVNRKHGNLKIDKNAFPDDSSLALDIVTIAYNNSETIITQHEFIKENIHDRFNYIVIDNSDIENVSQTIARYCQNKNLLYIRLKNNPYNGKDPSRSHGIALNWAYRNIIQQSKSKYFGFIDHDIYPIKNTSIICELKKSTVWGHYQKRSSEWYLWPGLCFFDKSFLSNKKINFLPAPGLDTGGGNWNSLFCKLDQKSVNWPSHKYIRYRKGKLLQSTHAEIIGDWLHLINSSGWKDGHVKTRIRKLIEIILSKSKIS